MTDSCEKYYAEVLSQLQCGGNLRVIPSDRRYSKAADFSTNDYLGYGSLTLRDMAEYDPELPDLPMTSSASRLLAATQREYDALERMLESLYKGKRALIFNSGYHANTGIIGALADRSTIILADRLVHASIIDGILLSRAKFFRFEHNNTDDLRRLLKKCYEPGKRIWIVVESVYSMDGDYADVNALLEIKREYPGVMLYVDEAHAFGVNGPHGLGLVESSGNPAEVDVTVATFGKALASYGAFAIVSETLRGYLLNRARSFIFSTSLPPMQIRWTQRMIERMLGDDAARERLRSLSERLHDIITGGSGVPSVVSHIQPLVTGDAGRAVELSRRLAEHDIIVLPIRTPTVPAGTERLRFSLSAALTDDNMQELKNVLKLCADI
ncbi:MAG: 8-amino-7-oxononanoate synthase [Muribaculaceae bacterium]|nr:8-amino-7-oxononanoate synthase [Muribaculaceae bacterium]